MKAMQLLATRRQDWSELEQLCYQLEGFGRKKMPAEKLTRFAALYRAACADLALADAYQLPPPTVHYLHMLVGRAHNQLYRSQRFNLAAWSRVAFVDLPAQLFADRTLWLAHLIFWGVLLGSCLAAMGSPAFVRQILGDNAEKYEQMYDQDFGGRSSDMEGGMAGFYISHNTTIGLQCFAYGMAFGVGGLIVTLFNAAYIGTVMGHMATTPQSDNFFHFVTAHGPCELTAIVLCSAAGMRLGFSLIYTDGLSRTASLQAAGRQAMPTIGMAVLLFFLAALIEGFISPSGAPYWFKAAVAVVTASMIFSYIVILGGRRSGHWQRAPGPSVRETTATTSANYATG